MAILRSKGYINRNLQRDSIQTTTIKRLIYHGCSCYQWGTYFKPVGKINKVRQHLNLFTLSNVEPFNCHPNDVFFAIFFGFEIMLG